MATKTKFQMKKCDLSGIFARNRDYGYSLEPPQSMFYNRHKKNNVYPNKPHFFLYKNRVWGGQNYMDMFLWRRPQYLF